MNYIWVILSEAVVLGAAVYLWFENRRLRRLRDSLLQEKEVIEGFIHDVAEVFADTTDVDLDSLLKRVLFYAMRATHAASGAIYGMEPDGVFLRARALAGLFPPLAGNGTTGIEHAMSKSQHIEHLVRTRPIRRGEGLIGQVADLGAPLLIPDAETDPRVPRYDLDFIRIRTLLLVPMRFHQKVLGVLVVANRSDGGRFEQVDLNLLQALADQASASIHYAGLRETLEEKIRIDNDLDAARRIQMSLLPKDVPRLEGIELAAFNYPALEIGGDYYDFIRLDDRHLGVVIADVSGKGIGGAIMMSVCRSVLRAHAPRHPSPSEALKLVNHVLSEDVSEDMFISVLYMVLDLASRELVVARAGHERPILTSADGRVSIIDSPGIAIGLAEREAFERTLADVRVSLKPGDVVVAYTDGITEAMNAKGEEWGVDSFLDAVRVAARDGASSVLNNVRQRLERFVGAYPQYDDMTLVALHVAE